MSGLAAWFAGNLVWASAAMLVVLAIRRPVARWLGAGIAYALWLVPLLRLLAPPVDWVADLFGRELPALPPLVLFSDEAGAPRAATAAAGNPLGWETLLLGLWAAGALLFLVYQAVSYRRLLLRLSRDLRAVGSFAGVPLLESAAAEGPIALGLVARRIVVPRGFERRFAPGERLLALAHERYHHKRGDILANHVALLVLALNWFNPVAWCAFRAFRLDQELSCDAAVAADGTAQMRSDYARALVKSACRPGLIAACPLNRADQLKRRLKMLTQHHRNRRRFWAGTALTGLLALGSMAVGSAGVAATPAPASARDGDVGANMQILAALQERRAALIESAQASPDPQQALARSGDALAFLDRQIKSVQDRNRSQSQSQSDAPRQERRERIIIMEGDGARGDHAAERRERREFRLQRDGAGAGDGEAERVANCRDGRTLLNVDEGNANQRTRFLICAQGEGGAQAQVEALQRARERIAEGDALSGETRQRVLAQIDAAIARARSGN